MELITCAKVWFSSITSTTCAECGTADATGGVGLGDGAGEGEGTGPGLGEGAGVGLGAGVDAGPGVVGVETGAGVAAAWEATALCVPPQPPRKSSAETTAHRTKMLKPILRVKRMYPPRQSWRVGAELLCLHREMTYLQR